MALHTIHTNWQQGSYVADRNNQIKYSENDVLAGGDLSALNAHDDSHSSVAIGYGYDLLQNVNTLTTDLANFVSAVQTGVTVATALANVQTLVQNFQAGTFVGSREDLANEINNHITLSTEENATSLLNTKVTSYETALTTALGADNLSQSKERAAVISLLYNLSDDTVAAIRKNIPNLITAIRENNRAAAWYEIRYASNKHRSYGVQNRRDKESDLFSLYSSTDGKSPVNENEMKNVIRFLWPRKTDIDTYISQIKDDHGNSQGNTDDLKNNLAAAWDPLVHNYGKGVAIDNIFVGEGVGQISELFADTSGNFNDSMSGTDKNDLMFGERGDDFLSGQAGQDVLYGGVGEDTLNGGAGNDILFGGDDQDRDTLQGGQGYDTYYVGQGDIISDADIFYTFPSLPHRAVFEMAA